MTDIEEIFLVGLAEIKTGGYGFMGKEATDLTKDELLIAYKNAVDSLKGMQKQLFERIEKSALSW